MQLLYQLDLRDQADWDDLELWLHDCKGTASEHDAASDLAIKSWRSREAADAAATRMSPDWPSNRQPPIDRAILRLAFFEMTSGRVHMKIAINEAIELAKLFSTGQSAAFINGVLDHLAKQLPSPDGSTPSDAPTPSDRLDAPPPSASSPSPAPSVLSASPDSSSEVPNPRAQPDAASSNAPPGSAPRTPPESSPVTPPDTSPESPPDTPLEGPAGKSPHSAPGNSPDALPNDPWLADALDNGSNSTEDDSPT